MAFGWGDYVPVAERRRKADQKVAKLKKQGRVIEPVTIAGRAIATTFWGKAWCENLEHYSDYESRLPKGRTYVRNGSVVDLQIGAGVVTAMVAGSELYHARITITPVASARWKAICRDCAGTIDSLVELLQGRLAQGVMDRVCRADDGLFPKPSEIKLSCSCPDWASMCKHVAAVLYGVGARLDAKPELLFALRGVDPSDLVAHASLGAIPPRATGAPGNVLAGGDLAALFGLDIAEEEARRPSLSERSHGIGRDHGDATPPVQVTGSVGARTAGEKTTGSSKRKRSSALDQVAAPPVSAKTAKTAPVWSTADIVRASAPAARPKRRAEPEARQTGGRVGGRASRTGKGSLVPAART
jgi:hypothetical protein